MTIPHSTLGQWAHHHSATASVQAHTSIRRALENGGSLAKHNVFLQGSYKNETNLRKDSDVDVVVQREARLQPGVAALSGTELEQNASHQAAHRSWRLFRREILKVLREAYGEQAVTSGRKSLKISKGDIQASADVVVTLHYETGVAFYLPDEHRWIVSYPQQHYERGAAKERATGNLYKRTMRMFKAARHHLIFKKVISSKTASSYFIECLLFNVPDSCFQEDLGKTYSDVVERLSKVKLANFDCQNGVTKLFGPGGEQWNANEARRFVDSLADLWSKWPLQ